MAIRFSKRISLFPGVRLNLSKRGFGLTLGPRGTSVSVGPGGVFANVGVPGTGLSWRYRLDGAGRPSPGGQGAAPRPSPTLPDERRYPEPAAAVADKHEHRSAEASALASPALEWIVEALDAVARRRLAAQRRYDDASQTLEEAERRLSQAEDHWLRRYRSDEISALRAWLEAGRPIVEDARDDLSDDGLELGLDLGDVLAKKWAAVVEAFDAAASSSSVWDITSRQSIDRASTRSSAAIAIERRRIRWQRGELEGLKIGSSMLHLGNANGADLVLTPYFLALRDLGRLRLVDLRDLAVDTHPQQFVEEEPLPSDAEVVTHTWAKTNKDGSQDRRFVGNYQIPVALYGRVALSTRTGLDEVWHVSKGRAGVAFGLALGEYLEDLGRAGGQDEDGIEEHVPAPRIEMAPPPELPPLPARSPAWTRVRLAHVLQAAAVIGVVGWTAPGIPDWISRMNEKPAAFVPPQVVVPQTSDSEKADQARKLVADYMRLAQPQSASSPASPSPGPAATAAPTVPPPDRELVIQAQRHLAELGYQVGAADGVAGARTRAAIASFRRSNGIGSGEGIDKPVVDALAAAVRSLPPKATGPSAAPAASARDADELLTAAYNNAFVACNGTAWTSTLDGRANCQRMVDACRDERLPTVAAFNGCVRTKARSP